MLQSGGNIISIYIYTQYIHEFKTLNPQNLWIFRCFPVAACFSLGQTLQIKAQGELRISHQRLSISIHFFRMQQCSVYMWARLKTHTDACWTSAIVNKQPIASNQCEYTFQVATKSESHRPVKPNFQTTHFHHKAYGAGISASVNTVLGHSPRISPGARDGF